MRADAPLHGVTVAAYAPITGGLPAAERFAELVKTSRSDCVAIVATATPAMAALTTRVRAIAPVVHLYLGSAGMCVPAWTKAVTDAIPSMTRLLMCMRPTLPLAAYPGVPAFTRAYQAAFGGATPGIYALLGYTAMQLGLDTIASLGRRGNQRAAVLAALFNRRHSTAMGTFSFNHSGDTTLDQYGLYAVGSDRGPSYQSMLQPGTPEPPQR
jgi:ABC-type branched-subunit amino acid transport system substrate-binding protein